MLPTILYAGWEVFSNLVAYLLSIAISLPSSSHHQRTRDECELLLLFYFFKNFIFIYLLLIQLFPHSDFRSNLGESGWQHNTEPIHWTAQGIYLSPIFYCDIAICRWHLASLFASCFLDSERGMRARTSQNRHGRRRMMTKRKKR